jgi:2-polyprenyl-6-methoxyphenol hydroxylase-like FAD-dependent oxidoreductase
MPRTVKVAVVGSGLAGLTAAHLLTKPSEDDRINFEVHLFEKVHARALSGIRCINLTISTDRLLRLAWTPRQFHYQLLALRTNFASMSL